MLCQETKPTKKRQTRQTSAQEGGVTVVNSFPSISRAKGNILCNTARLPLNNRTVRIPEPCKIESFLYMPPYLTGIEGPPPKFRILTVRRILPPQCPKPQAGFLRTCAYIAGSCKISRNACRKPAYAGCRKAAENSLFPKTLRPFPRSFQCTTSAIGNCTRSRRTPAPGTANPPAPPRNTAGTGGFADGAITPRREISAFADTVDRSAARQQRNTTHSRPKTPPWPA